MCAVVHNSRVSLVGSAAVVILAGDREKRDIFRKHI